MFVLQWSSGSSGAVEQLPVPDREELKIFSVIFSISIQNKRNRNASQGLRWIHKISPPMLGQDCIQSGFCTWRRHDTVSLTNSEILFQLITEVFQQPKVIFFFFLLRIISMSVCLTGISCKMVQISMLKPLNRNILTGRKLNTKVWQGAVQWWVLLVRMNPCQSCCRVSVQSPSSLSYLPHKTRTQPGSSGQKQRKQPVFHSPGKKGNTSHKSVRGGKTAPALCRGREESFPFPPTLSSLLLWRPQHIYSQELFCKA